MKSYKMSLNGTELIYNINEHCVLLGNRRLQLNKDKLILPYLDDTGLAKKIYNIYVN